MAFQILCIDDDPSFLLSIKIVLKQKFQVRTAPSLQDGLEQLKKEPADLIFLDMHLGEDNAIKSIQRIKALYPQTDVVMLSGERNPNLIVRALHEGASDYICKPCPAEELLAAVEKNLKNREVKDRYQALIQDMNTRQGQQNFVGNSDALTELLESAKRLKGYNASVMIEGESGTGKELMARYLHGLEGDSSRPFIAVNCAAIPENLLESELFGYEPGAFTGANRKKAGKFELANGGDIFLDEVNSLKPELQAKLLRVLQEKEFYRLGGTQSIQVNFRVISASNMDLYEEVKAGHFRQDLLYRLRVISFIMPALRDRKDDIPELTQCFLTKHSRHNESKNISTEVLNYFKTYHWPGNIRELENVLQSLIIMATTDTIMMEDLPRWMCQTKETLSRQSDTDLESLTSLTLHDINESLKDVMAKLEKAYIKKVIHLKGGNVTEAAKVLKISRSKVYYTLKGDSIG